MLEESMIHQEDRRQVLTVMQAKLSLSQCIISDNDQGKVKIRSGSQKLRDEKLATKQPCAAIDCRKPRDATKGVKNSGSWSVRIGASLPLKDRL